MVFCRDLNAKSLHIVAGHLPELPVVLLGGMVGIPIDPVTIYPNMRINAIPQVGVVGDLLFSPYILEPKSQLVHHTLIAVQQRQAESRIMIRMAQCNKFSPHLTVSVQATQAGTAYKDRIMDHSPVRKQFAEFLLKKVAHLLISQPFCFLGGEGAGC